MNFITKAAWKLIKSQPLLVKQILINYQNYIFNINDNPNNNFDDWLNKTNNYHQITMEDFKDFPQDMPFLEGLLYETSAINGIFNKWVAIKSKNNWYIKVGSQMWTYRRIMEEGYKVTPSQTDITSIVPCTKEVLDLYDI